jgi:hypothetical protein
MRPSLNPSPERHTTARYHDGGGLWPTNNNGTTMIDVTTTPIRTIPFPGGLRIKCFDLSGRSVDELKEFIKTMPAQDAEPAEFHLWTEAHLEIQCRGD